MVCRGNLVEDALIGNDVVRAVFYSYKGWMMGREDAPPRSPVGAVRGAAELDRRLIPIVNVAVAETPGKPLTGAGALVPRTSEHWERHRNAIEHLYLRQNKRLQDVMDIMAEQYQFRATSRMYKRQFAKWKWTKYNIQSSAGTPPTGQAFRGALDKSCKRLRASKRSPSPRSDSSTAAPTTTVKSRRTSMSSAASSAISRRTAAPTPPTSVPTLARYSPRPDDLTSLRCGSLLSVREYLKAAHGGVTQPGEGGPSQIKEYTIGCDSWHLVGLMDLALHKLRGEECLVGGRLLRHIFRDMGKSLDSSMCLQTFFGLCIQMPDYILRHGRLDILRIYLAYLADLGSLRLPGNHPLTAIVGMLKDLCHAFPASLPLCLDTLSRVWVDDLSQLRGPIDIHVLSARYLVQVAREGADDSSNNDNNNSSSVSISSSSSSSGNHNNIDGDNGNNDMGGSVDAGSDPKGAAAASRLISDFGLLLREASAVYDAVDPTCLFLEDQILHLQWRFDAYEDDFVERSRRTIASLLRKNNGEAITVADANLQHNDYYSDYDPFFEHDFTPAATATAFTPAPAPAPAVGQEIGSAAVGGEVPGGSGSGSGSGAPIPFATWPSQDLLVYQRCHLRLMEFLYRTGRLAEAHLVASRAIEAADDRMRLRWSGYLELLLRWMGRRADADEVRRRWGELPLLGELEREDRVELGDGLDVVS